MLLMYTNRPNSRPPKISLSSCYVLILILFMPPGPTYNWLCVVCSAADILSRAARIRASELAPRSTLTTTKKRKASGAGSNETFNDIASNVSTASSGNFDVARGPATDAGVEPQLLQVPPASSFAFSKSTVVLRNSESLAEHGKTLERSSFGVHQNQVCFHSLISNCPSNLYISAFSNTPG